MRDRTNKPAPARASNDWSSLHKQGWKYSGGNIATHSGIDPLWHATVFRVDKSGASSADGLFYNGLHLTMEYVNPSKKRMEPHVFFNASGAYDEAATLAHGQTKARVVSERT